VGRRLTPAASRRVAVALVATAAGAIAPAAAAAPLRLGFFDPQYQTEQPTQFWADAAALRPQVLRYNLDWHLTAPRKPAVQRNPADPAYSWAHIDGLVQAAAARNVPVLLTVTGTPRWAVKRPAYRVYRFNAIPNATFFRNFVAAAALRYSGRYDPDGDGTALPRVTRWEVWNEPNKYLYPHRTDRRGNFKRGGPITVGRDYAALVNGAYAELKRRSARNVVAAGSMAYSNAYRAELAPLNFLRLMRASRTRFDVVSIHPYNSIPVQGLRQGAGSTGPNIYPGNFGRFTRELDRLWPGRRTRIWLTEFGIQSYPDRFFGVSPQAQAAFLTGAVRLFRTRHRRVETLVWFLVRDEAELRGWQSGLRTAGGAKKPVYRAWLRARGR
jgi:hypothetical protein